MESCLPYSPPSGTRLHPIRMSSPLVAILAEYKKWEALRRTLLQWAVDCQPLANPLPWGDQLFGLAYISIEILPLGCRRYVNRLACDPDLLVNFSFSSLCREKKKSLNTFRQNNLLNIYCTSLFGRWSSYSNWLQMKSKIVFIPCLCPVPSHITKMLFPVRVYFACVVCFFSSWVCREHRDTVVLSFVLGVSLHSWLLLDYFSRMTSQHWYRCWPSIPAAA